MLNAYQMCRHMGWSWRAYQETPRRVRDLFTLYATWESNAAEAKREGLA